MAQQERTRPRLLSGVARERDEAKEADSQDQLKPCGGFGYGGIGAPPSKFCRPMLRGGPDGTGAGRGLPEKLADWELVTLGGFGHGGAGAPPSEADAASGNALADNTTKTCRMFLGFMCLLRAADSGLAQTIVCLRSRSKRARIPRSEKINQRISNPIICRLQTNWSRELLRNCCRG